MSAETEIERCFRMTGYPFRRKENHLGLGVNNAEVFDQSSQILGRKVLAKGKSQVVIAGIVDYISALPLYEMQLVKTAPGKEITQVEVASLFGKVGQAVLNHRRQIHC